MKETSKSIHRKLMDGRFMSRYFVGRGIDIGGRPDPLALYADLFPLIESVQTWDLEDGDAMLMSTVSDESFDFVYSSHCLEHLVDPVLGIQNWFRILRPGGHLIVTIPDEDLYEQGSWPSTNNTDHKSTFTVYKRNSWSPVSVNLFDLLQQLGEAAEVKSIQLQDAAFRYALPKFDQTLTPVCESAIEFIVRKRPIEEIVQMGLKRFGNQPSREVRIHLNQYVADLRIIKSANVLDSPFTSEEEL